MIESLQHLANGFGIAGTIQKPSLLPIGCIVGNHDWCAPWNRTNRGDCAFLSLLLWPNPTSAIIMLAGIYYGAMYGGSTTSNPPQCTWVTASVITCIDVTRWPRRKSWSCPRIVAIGSFIAGTIEYSDWSFLPHHWPRQHSLRPSRILLPNGALDSSFLSNVTGKSLLKSLMMAIVADHRNDRIDLFSGDARFTFGSTLSWGIEFVAVAIGLFELEKSWSMSINLQRCWTRSYQPRLRELYPSLQDLRDRLGQF